MNAAMAEERRGGKPEGGDNRADEPADRSLVLDARGGNSQAREALGRRVGRSAYLFAVQLTGDRDAALDIAQDGVVRFFNRLDRFDAERPIEPWLYQIVRNRVRDLARADTGRRVESLDALLETGRAGTGRLEPGRAGSVETHDPAANTERHELQRRIWSAVSELSPAHREIFILRDFHRLSYREIAESLEIPEGTVMSRLHAARTALRGLLTNDGETER